jgi:drug/metabolite transporter (DMT)-like permease
VLAFGLYHWLLRYAPAYRLGLVSYVIPVVALTIGWTLGGEPVTAMTLAGGAIVYGGVALAAGRRRHAPARPATPGEGVTESA